MNMRINTMGDLVLYWWVVLARRSVARALGYVGLTIIAACYVYGVIVLASVLAPE